MSSLDALIAKLAAWREHEFHADRELADEVLLADGWRPEPDPDFEGGIRWTLALSACAGLSRVSVSELQRPHPILDLNAAIAICPPRHDWRKEFRPTTMRAAVYRAEIFTRGQLGPNAVGSGSSPAPAVAFLIAALCAKRLLGA